MNLFQQGDYMPTSLHPPKLYLPIHDNDHIQGNPNAAITLVEYADFQCPYCAEAHDVIKEVVERFGDDLCFVFRHFPLTAIHSNALRAAEAAECAGAQGKFWEMSDLVFKRQKFLSDSDLLSDANMLELNRDWFEKDLMEHTYLRRIQKDIQSGINSGVNATPALFINGTYHSGKHDLQSLLAAILAETR
jgi:protein-disulfide isomerase